MRLLILALTAVVAVACAKNEDGAPEGESPAAGETTETADQPAKKSSLKSRKDKGSASATIGDQTWSADRCSARIRDGRLRISASRMEMNGGKANRQSLSLNVEDFSGPSDYTAGAGSSFVGVGLDVAAAKAAAEDDAKTADVAADSISKADYIRLAGATIKIVSVDDDVIAGSFEWRAPGAKSDAPTAGEFRAVVKD